MINNYDLIVVGAGPSSIFLAYELVQLNQYKNILLIEQGKRVENRNCPIERLGQCAKCKPLCDITCGFSGAGAFSDGKLSLYNPEDEEIHIGGTLHEYIGVEETKKLIDYSDKIYLEFGADKKLEGVNYKEEVKKIYDRAKKEEINLIDIPIRHLGTEKSHELYERIEKYLEDKGVSMLFETAVCDLMIENGAITGVKIKPSQYVEDDTYEQVEKLYANHVVLAVGRKGANWLSSMCEKHGIDTRAGVVDIGVRYELPDEIMADVNKYMYEGKFIGRPRTI